MAWLVYRMPSALPRRLAGRRGLRLCRFQMHIRATLEQKTSSGAQHQVPRCASADFHSLIRRFQSVSEASLTHCQPKDLPAPRAHLVSCCLRSYLLLVGLREHTGIDE